MTSALDPKQATGFFDLGRSEEIADWYEETSNRWPCYGCSKPTRVIYYPRKRALPPVFDCPENRFAPHAGSHRCPHFDPIPGYDELWS